MVYYLNCLLLLAVKRISQQLSAEAAFTTVCAVSIEVEVFLKLREPLECWQHQRPRESYSHLACVIVEYDDRLGRRNNEGLLPCFNLDYF